MIALLLLAIMPNNYADEMSLAFRAEHKVHVHQRVVDHDPSYFPYVPDQFKRFEDSRGCLMLRVPEYPEGYYCEPDHKRALTVS